MLKGKKINLLGNKPKIVRDSIDQVLKLFIAEIALHIYKPNDKISTLAFTFFDKLKQSNNFLEEFGQFVSVAVLNEFYQFLISLKEEINEDNPFDEKFKTLMSQSKETANYLCSNFNNLTSVELQLIENYIGSYQAEKPNQAKEENLTITNKVEPKIATNGSSLVRFDIKLPKNFLHDLFSKISLGSVQSDQPLEQVSDALTPMVSIHEGLQFGFRLADLFSEKAFVAPSQEPTQTQQVLVTPSENDELTIPQISDDIFGKTETDITTDLIVDDTVLADEPNNELSIADESEIIEEEPIAIEDEITQEESVVEEIDQSNTIADEEGIIDSENEFLVEGLIEETAETPSLTTQDESNNFKWLTESIMDNWKKNFSTDQYYNIINTAINQLLANDDPISAFREVSQHPEYLEFCDFLEVVATNPDFNRDFVRNDLDAISNKTYGIFVAVLREQIGHSSELPTEKVNDETLENSIADDSVLGESLILDEPIETKNLTTEEEMTVDDFSTPDELAVLNEEEIPELTVADGSLDLLDDQDSELIDDSLLSESKESTMDKPQDYFKLITKIFNDIKQLNSVDLNHAGINQFIDFSLSLKDPIESLREHVEIHEVKDLIQFIDVLHEKFNLGETTAYQPLIDHQLVIAEQVYQILKNHTEIYGDSHLPSSEYENNLRLVSTEEQDKSAVNENEMADSLDSLTTLDENELVVEDEIVEESISEKEPLIEEPIEEPAVVNEPAIIDELAEITDMIEGDSQSESSVSSVDDLSEILDEKPEPPKTKPVEVAQTTTQKPIERKELNEIQKIFLVEADEYIQKLSNELLLLEKELDNHSLIDSILRSAHTLKGSAGMMKFNNMNKLGHKMEDVFQFLRDNQVPADRELVDIMLRSTDLQQAMLNSLQENGNDYADGVDQAIFTLAEYLKKLEAKKSGTDYVPEKFAGGASVPIAASAKEIQKGDSPSTVPTQQQQGGRPVVAEQNLRINISTLNSLINLAAELLISRNRMTNQLGSMEGIFGKLQREKAMLGGIMKKIQTLAGKTDFEALTEGILTGEEQGILKDFADIEFDRFSEYDVIIKDLRSNISNFEDVSRDVRELGDAFRQSILSVSQIANELNREIMGMRMVPVKHMFIRFQRSIRDIGREEEKDVDLKVEGEETRLDKTVMEEVIEPIMHCVRNAVSHGIELPATRVEKGKPRMGMIQLRAFQDGNQVVLEIEDDGAGIDPNKLKQSAINKRLISPERAASMTETEAMELMFVPGFSTAEKVTTLSGRGVGMDVVKNVITRFKGSVSVKSNIGKGSKFIIRLPLTLAINQSLLINASGRIYAFPLSVIEETVDLRMDSIRRIGDQELITVRDQTIPLIHLSKVLSHEEDQSQLKAKYPVIILSDAGQKIGVRVDKLLGKEEIVIKTLGSHLKNVAGVVGATVLGDGSVVLILDVAYLFMYWQGGGNVAQTIRREMSSSIQELDNAVDEATADNEVATSPAKTPEAPKVRPKGKIRILCADDSVSIRKYVASLLSRERFDVTTASDGAEAYDLAERNSYDIIMTDLEMPKMHGYELVSALRSKPSFNHIPIVILTARSGEKHRRRGLELGANAFLNKPFDVDELLNTIDGLLGK